MWKQNCVLLISCAIHVLLIVHTGAHTERLLLQQAGRNRVQINESNVEQFSALVASAQRNAIFELNVDVLHLEEVLVIETPGLIVRGQGETPVDVECVGQGRLEITATRVSLQNLRIRNCRNGALVILNLDAVYNPFDREQRSDFQTIEVDLKDLEFHDNDAGTNEQTGGAIWIATGTSVVITRTLFRNNSASTGGAILIDGGATLNLSHSQFLRNRADLVGGAIAAGISDNFFETESSFSVINCTFIKNRDLSGGEDITGLTLANGAPLENTVFLTFPSPSPSGGAIYLNGFNDVEIEGSLFNGNKAVPAGGALYISDNERVRINNCTFDNNEAVSESQEDRVPDLELGGAIYLVFTDVMSQARIDRCLFRNNSAAFGGAIHTVTQLATKLNIENSLFEDNFANLAGGALLMRNTIQAKIRNVRFVRNRAISGGGMMLTNGAGAFLFIGPSIEIERDIYFIDNSALDGGGIFLLGAGQVVFQNVRFDGNRAQRNGGGICLIESLPSGRTTIQASFFKRNGARRGGALYVDSVANLDIIVTDNDSQNTFIQNRALAGGALHIRPSSQVNNLIKIRHSNFIRNQAVQSEREAQIDFLNIPDVKVEISALGRRLLFHRSLAQSPKEQEDVQMAPTKTLLDPNSLDACTPGGGGAICLLVAQVPERAPIEVIVSENEFNGNQARVGGALFLATNADEDWIPICDSSGSAMESLTSKPCKAMSISQVNFINNRARFAGGAIFISNPMSVYFDRLGNGQYISLDTLSSKDSIFQDNAIQSRGFGPNIASNAASMVITRPITSNGELLFQGHNSGKELEGGIELVLLDIYNQVVSNGISDSVMSVNIDSSIISGQRVASAKNGVVNFTRVIARGQPRHHLLVFEPNSLTIKSIQRKFSIRQCFPGEFRIDDQNICDECREEYFGFNYTYNCDGCPDNAICPGAATLVPKNGYWHSTPFSPIMHECIMEDACSYKDREKKLRDFFKDPSQLEVENRTFNNEDYPQCAEEYEGILCGSCSKGHGHVVDGECIECQDVWLTALLIGIVCIWTLFLLISTARQAYDTIREMQDVNLVRVMTISGARASESGNTETKNEAPPDGNSVSSEQSNKKFSSSSGDDNVDHIMAAEKVAEIIKILTNFLQITAVGVGINASWTESITFLLVIEDSISSISSGASFAPMECLFKNMEDRSLIGIVFRALFPIVLTGIYVLANAYKSRSDPKNLKRRMIIGIIVGLFFAYDTVSEMFMRIVSCISLDDVSEDPDATSNVLQRYGRYSIARESYWAEDTRHVCWKGSHAVVAGVLGVPGLVIFTFGLPIFLAGFLMYKRRQELVLDPEFLDTFGFVYQSYRVKFVLWESIVMLRKASMAAVIVYSYDLGPNLQSAIALGILIFALLAQFLAQPFKYNSLNVLESLSLLASIFVFYAGVIFKDPNTSYAGKVVLSIIILFTNISVVGFFLYCLFNAYDHLIVVKLRMEKAPIPNTVWKRIKQLSLIQAEKMKEKIIASTTRQGALVETLPESSEKSTTVNLES
eukprot:g7062.t1